MKRICLFLAISVSLCLISCNKDKPSVDPGSGTTYASLAVVVSNNQSITKAATDENATLAELAVERALLYGEQQNNERRSFVLARDPVLETDATTLVYNAGAWLTISGTRDFALIINANDVDPFNTYTPSSLDKAASDAQSSKATDITHLVNVTTPGDVSSVKSIVMSAVDNKRTVVVKDQVSMSQANQSESDGVNNRFDFSMRRTVAKAIVTNTGNVVNTTDGFGATVSDFEFCVINGRTSTYITPKETASSPPLSGSLTNPTGADFVRLGTIDGKSTLKGSGNSLYRPVDVGSSTTLKSNQGIYFMENIIPGGESDPSLYTWGNTAYAKVYLTYKPGSISKLDTDGTTIVPDAGYVKGSDFFKGATTGKVYSSKEAALADGNTKYYTYTGGRCMYRVWLNQAALAGAIHDTKRNTIYALNITEVSGMGDNYDVVDPLDPNLPKPSDPNEPGVPPSGGSIDTPTNQTPTYMRVVAKVQPWILISRDVTL